MRKERFVVKYGNYLEFKKADEISHFYAENNAVYLVDKENNRFSIDQTLTSLESQLKQSDFFRINRQFIISLNAIKRIKILPNRKLNLQLDFPTKMNIEVSRDRVSKFKHWIDL